MAPRWPRGTRSPPPAAASSPPSPRCCTRRAPEPGASSPSARRVDRASWPSSRRPDMAGTYAGLVSSPLGKKLAVQLGLPRPAQLRRYAVGAPLVDGPVLVGGLGEAPVGARVRALLDAEGIEPVAEVASGDRVGAVVADLTAVSTLDELDVLRTLVAPALKGLKPSGRVVVVGRDHRKASSPAQAAARRALEGFTRSLGKE